MKTKKYLLLISFMVLSLSMMGCPKIENTSPEIVQIIDGEIIKINTVVYEHSKGEDFHPAGMIQDLIYNSHIIAIDYVQSGVVIGQDREYIDISDRMVVTSFYEKWFDGDDANFDGVVDEADEEFYGLTKTDEDGNVQYDQGKIFLVEILGVGQQLDFTIVVEDDDGASTEITGNIIIVDPTI